MMKEYTRARKKARRAGIKMMDKCGLKGYLVFEDIMVDAFCVQLMCFSGEDWEVYDMDWLPTRWAARESGKEQLKDN